MTSDDFAKTLDKALRDARDSGATMVIELFELAAESGLCTQCAIREVKRVLSSTSYKAPQNESGVATPKLH